MGSVEMVNSHEIHIPPFSIVDELPLHGDEVAVQQQARRKRIAVFERKMGGELAGGGERGGVAVGVEIATVSDAEDAAVLVGLAARCRRQA